MGGDLSLLSQDTGLAAVCLVPEIVEAHSMCVISPLSLW
jgi:hypothetical protein